jgi:hypothetical protein
VASETDIDELILCLELCHHRLPVRAAKAEHPISDLKLNGYECAEMQT